MELWKRKKYTRGNIMSCYQCQGIEVEFSEKYVSRDLRKYRKNGPAKTTRILLDAIKTEGVEGGTLLDIGGGLGAIPDELLKSGASKAIQVEASTAYLKAAKEEAHRKGYSDNISFHHGNFVDVAEDISPVEIVTLDRVICCFDEMEKLVGLSAGRAGRLYGVVYLRDIWWIKIGFSIINFFFRLFHQQFQIFIHPTDKVEAVVYDKGLKRKFYNKSGIWQVIVYVR
jgi:magnesium-protoporphyrin O-methyltransferase